MHLCLPAGFFLFVALAWYFASHPPAPLAVTSEQMDGLWASVQDRFYHLRHGLDDSLHGLQDNINTLSQTVTTSFSGNLHALEDKVSLGVSTLSNNLHSIQDNIHTLSSSFTNNLHLLQGNLHTLSDNLHSLQDSLQHKAHSLSSNLANQASSIQHNLADMQHNIADNYAGFTASLNAHLQTQLKAVVQWPTPRWPVYVYFAGAMICLLTSTVCHLLGCCAKHISQLVWRFDYSGIAVLIVASFVPAVYYSFLCQPVWRNFYILSTALMGGYMRMWGQACYCMFNLATV